MAISASSAQAALSWLVLNSAGTTASELKAELLGEKDSVHLSLTTKQVGIKFTITCTGFELVGINLEIGGTLTNGSKVRYTGCEAYETAPLTGPLACHVHSAGQSVGTILTAELKGELVLHTFFDEPKPGEKVELKEILTKLEPKTGTTFATFLTEKCVVPETSPINGKLFLKDGEKIATTHAVKHLFEQGPLTSLWVGSDTAEHLETSLAGSGWIKLGGAHAGLKFAAFDG